MKCALADLQAQVSANLQRRLPFRKQLDGITVHVRTPRLSLLPILSQCVKR